MRLTTPDLQLAELGPVKKWLHLVTTRMLTVFLRSNLYNALPTLYGDLGVFGTGAMGVLEDTQDLFRCYNYPIGSFAIGMDERGIVNTFTREYTLTVGNLVATFDPGWRERGEPDWSKFSKAVEDYWRRKQFDAPIDVCWFVGPNRARQRGALDARRMPIVSCHYERNNERYDRVLRESGFNEFPILAPRWDVTGEDTYGTDCPGMTALGDIKALQIMDKRMSQAVEKGINPPLIGPTELRTVKTSLLPGDITYSNTRDGQQGLRPIHEVSANLDHMAALTQARQYRISRAFYEDLFLMLAQSDGRRGAQPVTAREIEERHEEKLLALGPALERMADELHDPLIDRVFAIMERAGFIPPPPEELEGVELKVEYLSIMAQAQKSVSLVGHDRFLQSSMALLEPFPIVRHKIDIFQAIDDYGEMLGVNPNLVRSDEDAQALLDAELEAQAAAQQAEQLPQIAAGVKSLGDTKMQGGSSALDQIVSGAQGAALG
jgi:hypothetical protein